MAILRCKESFAALSKNGPVTVHTGELLDSSHPLVKGREHLFEDVVDLPRREAQPVETATAAPGEKRVTPLRGRPRKDKKPEQTAAVQQPSEVKPSAEDEKKEEQKDA